MEANKIIITGGATRIGPAIAKKLLGPNREILIHYYKSKSEAESFNGEQRPSLYMDRIKKYQELRSSAITYKSALGCATDMIEDVLSKLEASVQNLLDINHK